MKNVAFEAAFDVDQSLIVAGAMQDLIGPSPTPRRADLLALARDVLGVEAPRAAEPAQYAAIAEHPLAEHAVTVLIVAVCLDRAHVEAEAVARLGAYARAARAGAEWVRIVRLATSGFGALATAALARRVPDGRHLVSQVWAREGLWGLLTTLGSPFGWTPADPSRAARFAAMAGYPVGTVGRVFVDTLTRQGIPLPGERGGLQEGALHHDLMHVLAGYSTLPEGECCLGGLYAGFGYQGWPAWIVVTLLTFEMGLRVGPTFTPPTRGAFDPRAVWRAAQRARTATFHPLDPAWDQDRLWALPLTEARRELGLLEAVPGPLP